MSIESADRGWDLAVETAAQTCEATYPCSCDPAYKDRGRAAPDCFRCIPLNEAATEIRALTYPGPSPPVGQRGESE